MSLGRCYSRSSRRRSFARSEEGMAVLEFALIATPIILLLMGSIEFGLIFFGTSVLNGATDAGAQAGKATLPEVNVKDLIKQRAGGLFNPNNIGIAITAYPSIVALTSDTNGTPGTGTTRQFVKYDVTYSWNIITPVIKPFFTGGVYPMRSTSIVYND